MKFSKKDIAQIKSKGLTVKEVEKQITLFQNGVPFTNLVTEATINDGIMALTADDSIRYNALFDAKKEDIVLLKFVNGFGRSI